ncbi:terpene cyclase [Gelatoporia subvermispora B]|uniref:Terpene cyclase n=1 Tax=Ceriporiopsis subvermispora (strain B) TaxID=914234 RepID=M2Q421_CERS8|nr:terpene cyclase [Gelatoporia subvermispora B]
MPTAVTYTSPASTTRPNTAAQSQASLTEISKTVISNFVQRLNITVPRFERDLKLEQRVDEVMSSWACPPCPRPYVSAAIDIAVIAYSYLTSLEAKVEIAIFTAIAITIDDPKILDNLSSEEFCYNVATGRIHADDGYLGEYVRSLARMWKHFPRMSSGYIFTSGIGFVDGCILENTSNEPIVSSQFIEYRRFKTGISDAFGCFPWELAQFPDENQFIQIIPDSGMLTVSFFRRDAAMYTNYANDIMSFYKEVLEGETGNYVQDRALVSGKTSLEALNDVIEDTIVIVERVGRILGEGKARDAWESYVAGYISYHVNNPRYRLADIIETTRGE